MEISIRYLLLEVWVCKVSPGEIIGEASKQISPEIKSAFPLIEWQLMTDFRNLLTHHYFGIEYEILWKTINEDLPFNYELLKQVKL